MKISKKLIFLDGIVFCYLGLSALFFLALSIKTELSPKAFTNFYAWLALTPFLMAGLALALGILVNIFYFRASNKIIYPLFYTFTLTSLLIGTSCLAGYFYMIF